MLRDIRLANSTTVTFAVKPQPAMAHSQRPQYFAITYGADVPAEVETGRLAFGVMLFGRSARPGGAFAWVRRQVEAIQDEMNKLELEDDESEQDDGFEQDDEA